MALRRAFSFSDDSVDVSEPPGGARLTSNWEQRPQSFEAANHLLGIRRLQSGWYQALFQSGREPYPESNRAARAFSDDMRRWFETTSKSLPLCMRTFFELELLYSYVYVMTPSRRIPDESNLARLLTFEHCILFADRLRQAMTDREAWALYPPPDALRVYLIGSRFLDTIEHFRNQPSGQQLRNPLELSARLSSESNDLVVGTGDNLTRSISCISQVIEILGIFGARWARSAILQRIYQEKASFILRDLHRRRLESSAKSTFEPYGTG